MFRLMCITAHPDDEVACFGGTLLKYREKGLETHLICLTSGTAATHRGGARDDAELGELRRREFQESCRILEVSHHEVLDYPDGALDRQPFREVVMDLVRKIRRTRPHVIATFGSEGGLTGHLDHAMTSLFVTAAFHWAGRSSEFTRQIDTVAPHRAQKLYYATALVPRQRGEPVCLAPCTASIDVSVYLERKVAAFQAHRSQQSAFTLVKAVMQRHGRTEFFHVAASAKAGQAKSETDLFDGVIEE